MIVDTPQNIEVFVPFGSTGTNVDWTPPRATDNSGTVTPQGSREPGSFFPVGTTTPVTYTFTDPTGNQAQTTFTVTVTELRKYSEDLAKPSTFYPVVRPLLKWAPL